jgi:dsDNA-specific endonuclease/ATPase MutS2
MTIIDHEALNLLDFHKIKNEISLYAHSEKAKQKASQISTIPNTENLITELNRVSELNTILSNNSFFPNLQFEDFKKEVIEDQIKAFKETWINAWAYLF